MELAVETKLVAALGSLRGRKSIGPQAGGQQHDRSCLAAAHEKVTAAQIDRLW